MARLSLLGAVACCGVVLSAAGTPSAGRNADAHGPNALAIAAAQPTPSTYSERLRDIPRSTPSRQPSVPPSRTASRSRKAPPSSVAPPSSRRVPPPSPTPPTGGKPGPTNTGVPAGTSLAQYNGNLTVTAAGATYDALDIHGFVTIEAPNVTIKNSIIRGGVATSGNPGLVDTTSASATNFVLEDSEVVPEHPSVAIDGFRGGNFTLLRVNIHGTNDGVKIIGGNTTITNSWIHGTVTYAHDPYHDNGQSHNDAIQVITGDNIHITGSTIVGGSNSGLQITQGQGKVGNLSFTGNWADGGGCTLNVADEPLPTMSGINISDNIFGHTSRFKNCAIIVSSGVALQHTGNRWAGTGQPVAITPRS